MILSIVSNLILTFDLSKHKNRIRTIKQRNIRPLLIDGDRKPFQKSVAYRWVLLIHGVAYSG